MDRVDYTFKFSTELIVLILSVAVIGTNFAGAESLKTLTSGNLLTKELSYRSSLNKLLYNKTTAVTTVVAGSSGFIPSASAQVVLASDQLGGTPGDAPQNSIIANNAISAEYPDNIKDLIANQIQNYTVQPGDTLKSLSEKFNISENTIKWANNLSGNKLVPGTTLSILPINGVLYKMTANDTLPDVAKKFNANIDKIISYNGLCDASCTEIGDVIVVPDGIIPAPIAKPVPVSKHVIRGKTVYTPRIDLTPSAGHIFPWGQCTYYVAFRWDAMGYALNIGGNANHFLSNGRAAGYETGSTPMVGAIVQMKSFGRWRRYGHVALVEQIQGDEIVISEMNFEGLGVITHRRLAINSSVIDGYLYHK